MPLPDLGGVDLARDLAPPADLATQCSPPPHVVLNAAHELFPGLDAASLGGTARALATADFNHDGILDLVTDDTGIALGQGHGQFAAPVTIGPTTSAMTVTDLDGDGNLDLVGAGDALQVWLGRGDGTFSASPSPAVAAWRSAPVVADFDGDGHPDIVATIPAGSLSTGAVFLPGRGDGTFGAARPLALGAGYYPTMATADFNGDGKPDLVAASNGNVSVNLGYGGDGTFGPPLVAPVNEGYSLLEVVPIRSGGAVDLLISNFDTDVSVLVGHGDGTFSAGASYPAINPRNVLVADVNGDGVADAVVNSDGDFATLVLLGNDDGTFTMGQGFPLGVLAVGDFSGDGHTDLVTTPHALYLGAGAGTFFAPASRPAW